MWICGISSYAKNYFFYSPSNLFYIQCLIFHRNTSCIPDLQKKLLYYKFTQCTQLMALHQIIKYPFDIWTEIRFSQCFKMPSDVPILKISLFLSIIFPRIIFVSSSPLCTFDTSTKTIQSILISSLFIENVSFVFSAVNLKLFVACSFWQTYFII